MSDRNPINWLAVALVSLCHSLSAPAVDLPRLHGTVTRVVDGDTLDVQLESGPIRVRLHGIDAPERGQTWGKEARAAITKLVLNRKVELEPFRQDRYDRLIARVFAAGREVNAELIEQGHAWAYRRYMTKVDARYCRFEAAARTAGTGLWGLKQAEQVPPWQWRRQDRTKDFHTLEPVRFSVRSCVAEIGK